jgi:hypothetical protein
MTASAYMLVALITASGSCQEPQIPVQKMASLELCRVAVNLVTNVGGHADCVPMPLPSPSAGAMNAVGHHWQEKRFRSSAGSKEVQQLNRAQLGQE